MDRLSRKFDPPEAVETFAYDQVRNPTSTTDRKGQTTTFMYDPLNRRSRATYADGTVATFTYDAGGRLMQADDTADPRRPIRLDYDLLDRLLAETTAMGTVAYQYDVLGRRTQMQVNDLSPVTYTYDSASRLRTITQAPLNPVNIDYDALGRRTTLTLPNGVSTEYQYDAAARLTALIYRNTTGLLGDLTYTYDPAGNRTGVGGSFARTLLPDPVVSAIYDAANRQLTFGDKTMTYDANGNLTSITDPNGIVTLDWDSRDQLTKLTAPTISGAFEYDARGRRGNRILNGQNRIFQYDGRNVVGEGGLSVDVFSLGGLGLDEVWARHNNANAEEIITDGLGSALAYLDPQARVSTELSYEPFGRATRSGMVTDNPLTFTGREDDGTGLYFYRSRYYHPALARYISEDPLGFRDGINAYTYVRNRPTNARDPLGLLTLIVHGIELGKPSNGYSKELGRAIRATGERVAEIRWSGNLFSGEATSDAFRQIAEQIAAARPGEPINIIAHSWGSVLGANYLAATGTSIDLLVTMGSPLSAWAADPTSATVWVNILSPRDSISWGSITTRAQLALTIVGHTGYWSDPITRQVVIKHIKQQKKRRR